MKYFLTVLILAYLGALGAVYLARKSLIYPFDATRVTPKTAGLSGFTEQTFQSFDGTDLVIWSRQANSGKPTILYFHGNAGNLAGRAERFDRLARRGYGVVAMAYRGSSGSQGRPDETLITKDAAFLRDQIAKTVKGTLIYYGESLGTGVAIKLATTHPPDALVLEAPYTSITDRAAAQMPIFPVRLILDQRWDSATHIKSVSVPTFVIHGTNDAVIPFSDGQAIFNASPAATKILKKMQGAHHHDLWSVEGQTAIYAFIDAM